MFRFMRGSNGLVCAFVLCSLPALAQQTLPDGPTPKPQAQQGVPDAPQPKNSPSQFPDSAPPAPKNVHEESAPAPASTPTPGTQRPAQQPGVITDVGKLGTMTIAV